ncbi:FRG domain-containing protein [Pantoea ananatis]|uniref:FRG domain-containing protein n=1 Tax=Pantoea ananas TaxID=553 RepID=UPI0014049011|nr:FRG domain-containing protein [Pantoea ananatis]
MFNLIMSYDEKSWDVAVGETGHSSIDLSRYLEFTKNSITNQFKMLDYDVLENLKKMPCLFINEFTEEKKLDGKNEVFTRIRIGYLKELHVENKKLHYSFVFLWKSEYVIIENIHSTIGELFYHFFEFSRTHWAIKDIHINNALNILGVNDSIVYKDRDLNYFIKKPSEDEYVTSVVSYLEKISFFRGKSSIDLFYRGHSDINFKLEPSVFRTKNSVPLYKFNEREMVNEILTAHPGEFMTDQYMLDKLVRMQHYGLPTRLLDVTANPLIALFFCCKEGFEVDNENVGDVKIFEVRTRDVKFYNSDTVSCIANLSLLDTYEKNQVTDIINPKLVGRPSSIETKKKLLHFIRSEKPYFEDRLNKEHLRSIFFVRGRISNDRINSQSGAFLLFGHDAVLPDTGHSDLIVHSVKVKNKKKILKELEMLNIKNSTVFPGIEETARYIANKFKLTDEDDDL